MSFKKQFTTTLSTLFLGLALTACGGGGGTQTNTNTTTDTSTDTPTDTTTNTTPSGQYDFSKYLFHSNLLSSNGQIDFTEKFHTKETGEQTLIPLNRKFTSTDGVFIEEFSNNNLYRTYKINANNIEETIISANATRSNKRFINVGDTILNANFTSTLGEQSLTQNATCVLLEHLDSFDLATAAGNYNLASGVYNDVLKLECVTGFVSNGTISPHTTLRSYHAKDVGVIFGEGTLFFGGDVYITEEY